MHSVDTAFSSAPLRLLHRRSARERRFRWPSSISTNSRAINDGYGHAAGDRVLKAFSAILAAAGRSGDLVGRIGGDEFALVLCASCEQAASLGEERICAEVRRRIPHPAGADRLVTVSGGVAAVSTGLEPEVAISLALVAADEALYLAKREGGDRIAVRRKASDAVEPVTATRRRLTIVDSTWRQSCDHRRWSAREISTNFPR